jgi:hypothetical protein
MFMCGAKEMRGERRGKPIFIPPGSGREERGLFQWLPESAAAITVEDGDLK